VYSRTETRSAPGAPNYETRIKTLNAVLTTKEDQQAVKDAFIAAKGDLVAALPSLKEELPKPSLQKVVLAHSPADWTVLAGSPSVAAHGPVSAAALTVRPQPTVSPSPSLREIALSANLDISAELEKSLAAQGIRTLADLQNAGPLKSRPGLPVAPGNPMLSALDSFADLSRLGIDLRSVGGLIGKGYGSAQEIAAVTRSQFVSSARDLLGSASAAAELHVAARAQISVLNNVLVGFLAEGPDHTALMQSYPGIGAFLPELPSPCSCKDCMSAASPAAYLADLIVYALNHLLRDDGSQINPPFLYNTYYQPFTDLPTDCEAVSRVVRQVRICAEVLRSYLAVTPPSPLQQARLDAAVRDYCLAAYTTMLNRLSTSYDELRLARTAVRAKRAPIASQIGLAIGGPGSMRPDHLDALLLDPAAPAGAANSISETTLERLFGIVDSTRDPLFDGLTSGDTQNQIGRWNLRGVEWRRNTDDNGVIYAAVFKTPLAYEVGLYRDAARNQVVATGVFTDRVEVVQLAETNNSGLTGAISIRYVADSTTIAFQAMPMLSVWQLQALRPVWQEQDRPTDPYSEGESWAPLTTLPSGVVFPASLSARIRSDPIDQVLVFDGVMSESDKTQLLGLSADKAYQTSVLALFVDSQRPPLIDPDIIGPDDFRVPVAKTSGADRAFDLWLRRRSWVDARLHALELLTKSGPGMVPDFSAMLASMYGPVGYGSTTIIPWAATTPTTALDTLRDRLEAGTDVSSAVLAIRADLRLSVDAFLRLMNLRLKDQAAAADPRNSPLGPKEWREVRSILVEAQKVAFFSSWRAEEQAATVRLGPEEFWARLRQAQVGDWPPVVLDGQPMIDPHLVTAADLPDPTVGARACAFLQNRQSQLDQLNNQLQTQREAPAGGFDSMLSLALGDPNPGDPLPDDVSALFAALSSTNPSDVTTAEQKITSDFFMSRDEFTHLMAAKTKDDQPNPLKKPTAAELRNVYAILTAASKRKRLYPDWIAKEKDPINGVTYWTALRARLPPWRASYESWLAWAQALQARSSAPIIDPDLIGPIDLKNPTAGDAAFDLWSARGTWVSGQLTSLRSARESAASPLVGIDAVTSTALGVAGSTLQGIDTAQTNGEDIRARVAQFGLTPDAFAALLRVRKLASAGAAILGSEWSDVYSILTQAQKTRQFAAWREQERAADITEGPDWFTIAPPPPADVYPPPEPPALPAWRATLVDYQSWQDTVQARMDMQSAAIAAELQAADSAEENTIEKLRDALIMATDAPGNNLATNAPWVTQRFMIDAQESACRKITRIEQAIETLQGILLGARTGQPRHAYIDAGGPVTSVDRTLPTGTTRDLFVVGSDGAIYINRRDPAANSGLWTGWYIVGDDAFRVPLDSTVTPVARDGDHLNIFVVGYDGGVYTNSWDRNAHWQGWRCINIPAAGQGVPLTSVITALARDAAHVSIFTVGLDGGVHTSTWDAPTGTWQSWQLVGNRNQAPTLSVVGAVARDAGSMDIFVVGNDMDGQGHGAVCTNQWDGSWHDWKIIGHPDQGETVPTRSVVTACSRASDIIDIFVVGNDLDGRGHGGIYTNRWTGASTVSGAWATWAPIGNPSAGQTVPLRSVVSAVARGPGIMDIFVVGNEGGIWSNRWTGSNSLSGSWGTWYPIGDIGAGQVVPLNSVIAATASPSQQIDLFVVGFDHEVYTNLFDVLWRGWVRVGDGSPTLEAPNFDEEWTWLGTYASWRAAMLVWMWPENVLNPSLRRWQTPAFCKLVADARASPRIDSAYARAAAQGYAAYFQDVLTLKRETVEGSCLAWSRLLARRGCAVGLTSDVRALLYMFGRGGATGTVYWSSYDEAGVPGYEQSFWDVVPGLDNVSVLNVVGAAPFQVSAERRYVFLFLRTHAFSADNLGFVKYDLETGKWDTIFTLLPTDQWPAFTAFLETQNGENDPPRIGVRLPDGTRYERRLHRDGNRWGERDWAQLDAWAPWYRVSNSYGIVSVVSRVPDHLDLFWVDAYGNINSTWWDEYFGGGRWSPIFSLGTLQPSNLLGGGPSDALVRGIAAISREPDHLDLFVVGLDNQIWSTWWDWRLDQGRWHDWFQVMPDANSFVTGGASNGPIAVTAQNSGLLDLFAPNGRDAGNIWGAYWDGQWHPWQRIPLGGTTPDTGQVVALATPPDRIDVLTAMGGYVQQMRRIQGLWGSWGRVGNSPDPGVQPFTAIVHPSGRQSIFLPFGQDASGNYQIWTDAGGPWRPVNTAHVWRPLSADPIGRDQVAVVARALDSLDLFVGGRPPWTARAEDGMTFPPGWFPIGDLPGGSPAAVSRFPARIDLFVSGSADAQNMGIWQTYWQDSEVAQVALPPGPVAPSVTAPLDIPDRLTPAEIQARASAVATAYLANESGPRSQLEYLNEAYYFVPMFLGLALEQQGEFRTALDLYRTVYDFTLPANQRKIFFGLVLEESLPAVTRRASDWLLDPLNPHMIAAARRNTYTRFTLLSIVRCLLDEADAEFTHDTSESDSRARSLYRMAQDLLSDLVKSHDPCEGLTISYDTLGGDAGWQPMIAALNRDLATLGDSRLVASTARAVSAELRTDQPIAARFASARSLLAAARAKSPQAPAVGKIIDARAAFLAAAYPALLAEPALATAANDARELATGAFRHAIEGGKAVSLANPSTARTQSSSLTNGDLSNIPLSGTGGSLVNFPGHDTPANDGPSVSVWVLSYSFCLPPNPVPGALRLHAEMNLYKLRHCMNIAGMQRQVDSYSAPTNATSGLPTIGAAEQPASTAMLPIQPTPYRYSTLVDRAKQIAQLASQIETAMLAALEKRDAEAYTRLKAAQDARLAGATVQLQTLRVSQAQDGIALAQLQTNRAQAQASHWSDLLSAGITENERIGLNLLSQEAGLHMTAAYISGAAAVVPSLDTVATFGASNLSNLASEVSSLAAAVGNTASIYSTLASYERRAQDWAFQRDLANQDIQIGQQQVSLARDQVQVAVQGQAIAQIQSDQAQSVMTFLSNKFTNAELYDWMSGVLQRVYAFLLQQAAAMAKLAENQLAFERQEAPAGYIQADYWTDQALAGGTATSNGSTPPDRKGLTGSARLLQDIYQLDQYAFETDRRKLQLSKTVSLAQLDPFAFQQFTETGVLRFSTSMGLFDWDFPGHYLRLIKRIRASVVALIPPTQGIHATLSTTGTTRVVTGKDRFQTVVVRRDLQSVALSSPTNASGVFELDPQSELLLPFEGLGVDGAWEFRMPRAANRFDYSTIADVLLTIDYTALESFSYRQQVMRSLRNKFSADRPYSFRFQLADAWYDLHNPDQTATPMIVRFQTLAEDFPSNIEDLRIQQVVLYFSRAEGATFEIPVNYLWFTAQGGSVAVGGAATSAEGVISTRRGNAGSWLPMIGKSPVGDWELSLPDSAQCREWFSDERIREMLFVVTYRGRTPDWPE
jgi:hypothetical protein